MQEGTLTIYSASAGSGKTYKLTGIYLNKLFQSPYNYRKILAVTFTNKATAEMKSRILDQLWFLSDNKPSEYLNDLIKSTGRSEKQLREEAKDILYTILHDYSRFSVSTIDAFFQKILRAFAREVGLHSGFNIELDHSTILADAVSDMIASASTGTQLSVWLTEYAKANIEESKSWNLKGEIMKLAEELFREKFKLLSADEQLKLRDKEFMLSYIKEMISITAVFQKKMSDFGKECESIYIMYNLSDEMFYQKGRGIPSFIRSWAAGKIKSPNSYLRAIHDDPPKWSSGPAENELKSAIAGGLEKTLKEAIQWYDSNIRDFKTAITIRSNIFALGILSDVLRHVHLITNDENSFLLSDAGEILYLITSNDQAPFIYEKVGNRFENFMIDEFQDTSIIQWNNFSPLISNSMAQGFDNLVVGDIKQSIYRWRNSDWQILGSIIKEQKENSRFITEPLKTNWRSCANIIKFNNTLFSIIPSQIDEALADKSINASFKTLFSEAVQIDPGRKKDGYVKLEFIKEEDETKWNDTVLQRLPSVIEFFEDKGYDASDIGIIVRTNFEGTKVLKRIIEYTNSCSPEKRRLYNYNIVSNESLLLSQSNVITFIISVLKVINDGNDNISRAEMLRFYLLATGKDNAEKASLLSESLIEESAGYFPDGNQEFMDRIVILPLFELTEKIIGFFGLGNFTWNIPYLNTFQDHVLSFSGSRSADTGSFLEWWQSDGIKKSVVLPENQKAIKVLTIHKAKGLEFKIVILPFLSWDLDHKPFKNNILWVKPKNPPFNKLGIVPVRYKKDLEETIFEEDYRDEKYSAYLDNVNLLYVAMTRAINALYGFLPDGADEKQISGLIRNAVQYNQPIPEASDIILNSFYNSANGIFEYGTIPANKKEVTERKNISAVSYSVSEDIDSLRLKLHGENYLAESEVEFIQRINYGKLMHEVFEGIITQEDVKKVIMKMILEGKIPEIEAKNLELKIISMITTSRASKWFDPENTVMTEPSILLPSGVTRRPDRVIFKDGKTTIIDFKFGEENTSYNRQINQYRSLLSQMGYTDIEAFIWYVDIDKIVTV